MQHTILNFINQHFFVGIDVHLKQWKVTIRSAGIELKTFSMNPSPQELFQYLRGTYHLVYEAGFCDFWIQRAFSELGIQCIVVHPADTPTSAKEKVHKTDPVDSRKLARELEHGSLKALYVPQVASEQLRSLMRLRFRLVQQQTRTKNRIKGFLRVNDISFRQNSFLRTMMIEAAWTAVREDPAMTLKFKELTKRMNSQNAIIRIAKKLLKRIRHVWLNQEEYVYALVA